MHLLEQARYDRLLSIGALFKPLTELFDLVGVSFLFRLRCFRRPTEVSLVIYQRVRKHVICSRGISNAPSLRSDELSSITHSISEADVPRTR